MLKRYVDDPELPWPERYRRLEEHHLAEVAELTKKLTEARLQLEQSSVTHWRSKGIAGPESVNQEGLKR